MNTQPTAWTYAQAGVDLDDVAQLKRRIATLAAQTFTPGVVGGIGHFGGLFRTPGENMLLVSSVDSVGTKVLIAALLERYDGLGIDIVHHCINDVLACGARPLFFLDYLGLSRLNPAAVEAIVRGIAHACHEAGCALIGGETAQLPGLYRDGAFDIVGCIVGAVRADHVLDGSAVRAGDVLVGLPSKGFIPTAIRLPARYLVLMMIRNGLARFLLNSPHGLKLRLVSYCFVPIGHICRSSYPYLTLGSSMLLHILLVEVSARIWHA